MIVGIFAQLNTVIDRFRARIRESLERFTILFAPRPDPPWLVRLNRHIHSHGPARLLAAGVSWQRGFSPAARARFTEDNRKCQRRKLDDVRGVPGEAIGGGHQCG